MSGGYASVYTVPRALVRAERAYRAGFEAGWHGASEASKHRDRESFAQGYTAGLDCRGRLISYEAAIDQGWRQARTAIARATGQVPA